MDAAPDSANARSSGYGRQESLPEMSLVEHLDELRRRLFVALGSVAAGTAIAWFVSDRLFRLFVLPVTRLLPPEQEHLAYLSLTEPFVLYLKVALVAGILLASPVIIAQAWLFVAPGLYRHERRYAAPIIGVSSLFFLLGAAFGYAVLFPIMAEFFLEMGETFRPVLSVSNLFGFLLRTLLGCGLIFEWPVVVFFLARLGILTAGTMWRGFRYAVLIIFIVAAVVTPTPDMATQTILATPMLALYLLGIGIAWLVQPDSG